MLQDTLKLNEWSFSAVPHDLICYYHVSGNCSIIEIFLKFIFVLFIIHLAFGSFYMLVTTLELIQTASMHVSGEIKLLLFQKLKRPHLNSAELS